MAEVTIMINGRPHTVACEDGQEPRLHELASTLDAEVRGIASAIGQIGDSRLLVITGLSLVDRMKDLEGDRPAGRGNTAPAADRSAEIAAAEERATAAETRAVRAEEKAVVLARQLADATKRIDTLAAGLEEA